MRNGLDTISTCNTNQIIFSWIIWQFNKNHNSITWHTWQWAKLNHPFNWFSVNPSWEEWNDDSKTTYEHFNHWYTYINEVHSKHLYHFIGYLMLSISFDALTSCKILILCKNIILCHDSVITFTSKTLSLQVLVSVKTLNSPLSLA